jgi:hypothetical protein
VRPEELSKLKNLIHLAAFSDTYSFNNNKNICNVYKVHNFAINSCSLSYAYKT